MTKKLLFFALMAFGLSNAQNIFRDDFASYTVNSPLNTQGGWTNNSLTFGLGQCNPVVAGQPCFASNVGSSSLSYLNYGTSTKGLQLAGFVDNPGIGILPVVSSGDLYISFVLNLSAAPAAATTTDFIRIANGLSSSIAFRVIVKDAGFGYNIGIKKGASNNVYAYSTGLYNYNDSVLVVLKYSIGAGPSDDSLKLFVNPNFSAGEPTTNQAIVTSGFDQAETIDRFAFYLGVNSAVSKPTGFAGLVSAARTWSDLAFPVLGINKFENNNVNVFSNNVSNGVLNITTNEPMNNVKLNIYTITGALIEKQIISLTQNNNQIKINPLSNNSIYIAELIDELGNKYVKKITLN